MAAGFLASALPAAAPAQAVFGCTLVEATDRSKPDEELFRVRLRYQCATFPTSDSARRLAEEQIERRRRRRRLDVAELLVHGPGPINLVTPDAYVLWARANRAEPYAVHTGSAAQRALMDSPLALTSAELSAAETAAPATAPSARPATVLAPERSSVGVLDRAPPVEAAAADPLVAATERSLVTAEVNLFLSRWRDAWQAQDLNRYLSCYSRSFRSGEYDLDSWRARKRTAFARARRIRVELENIEVDPTADGAVVSFIQHYRSDRLEDRGYKRLTLRKEAAGYRIVREDWSKL